MEDPAQHGPLQEPDHPGPDEGGGVEPGGPHPGGVVEGEAGEALHDQHPAGDEVGMGPGHHVGLLPQLDQRPGDVEHVLGLEAEVELLGDRLGEQLHQRRRVGQGGHRDAADQPRGDPGHDGQVLPDQPGHLGPLDLDDDVLARPEPGVVDLGDRRRRQRLGVEAGEDRLQGPAEVLLHHPPDGGPRLGRHLVAALLELRHQRLGEHALAGGDDLAQLDVGRAEPLGRPPQPPGQVGHRLRPTLWSPGLPALARRPDGHADAEVAGGGRQPPPGREPAGPDQRRHLGPHRPADVVEARQPAQPVDVDLPRPVVRERPQRKIVHRPVTLGVTGRR